jgi:hypothetical protein
MARARHVLDDQRRRARDVPREVAADQSRPEVVILSRRGADHEPDLLATVEIRLRLRRPRRREQAERHQDGSCEPGHARVSVRRVAGGAIAKR